MHYLFHKCSSLISVDLSNFKTPKLIKIQNLFSHCNNLQYINLKNFDLQSVTTKGNEINEVPKNVIACINQNKASYLYQLIKNLGCSNIYCGDDWYLYKKKLNKETNNVFINVITINMNLIVYVMMNVNMEYFMMKKIQ